MSGSSFSDILASYVGRTLTKLDVAKLQRSWFGEEVKELSRIKRSTGHVLLTIGIAWVGFAAALQQADAKCDFKYAAWLPVILMLPSLIISTWMVLPNFRINEKTSVDETSVAKLFRDELSITHWLVILWLVFFLLGAGFNLAVQSGAIAVPIFLI